MIQCTVEGPVTGRRYDVVLPLWGAHQAANAATAIGLLEAAGVELAPATVRRALWGLRLPGRIEVRGRRPWLIVDVAHNAVSARALAEVLRAASPRAADPWVLAREARGPALVAPSVAAALEAARRLAGPRDAVVVTGSFYVAGEALAFLDARRDG